MKKIALIAVLVLFSLSACVPGLLNRGAEEAPAAAPEVDVNATADSALSTQAAETFVALSTPTLAEVMPEANPEATATETLTPTEEASPTPTGTPENAEKEAAETATPTETLPPTETGTPAATATSVYPSPTSPISVGLPPQNEVPYHTVDVTNNTKGPVYISLQGSTEGGYHPIIEYDIPKWTKVKLHVPEGYYAVIVYVGADPMIDYTGIYGNDVSIVIKPDELKIKK